MALNTEDHVMVTTVMAMDSDMAMAMAMAMVMENQPERKNNLTA